MHLFSRIKQNDHTFSPPFARLCSCSFKGAAPADFQQRSLRHSDVTLAMQCSLLWQIPSNLRSRRLHAS